MAGATLFDHIKAYDIHYRCINDNRSVAYAVMGFMFASGNEPDLSTIDEITTFIQGSSNISILALIPPAFVILAGSP